VYNSPRTHFAFCAKAHKGPNLLCHQVLISPLHMKKEQMDHDKTALPFHMGSGPTASPPEVAQSAITLDQLNRKTFPC